MGHVLLMGAITLAEVENSPRLLCTSPENISLLRATLRLPTLVILVLGHFRRGLS